MAEDSPGETTDHVDENDDAHRSSMVTRGRKLVAKLEHPKRRRAKRLDNIDNALFLHLGKAGGGTVQKRIVHLGFNFFYVHPNPDVNQKYRDKIQTYLINLRDPIDRFLSNFYWSGLLLCYPQGNDTREALRNALHAVEKEPHRYCRTRGESTEAEAAVIHSTYGGNAELLAMALCDSNESVREQASDDLRKLTHAKHSLSDWLATAGVVGNSTAAIPVGMVLEASFDFNAQIDGALAIAWIRSEGFGDTAEGAFRRVEKKAREWDAKQAQTQQQNEKVAVGGEEAPNNASSGSPNTTTATTSKLHSSRPPDEVALPSWVESMQEHRKRGIADEAACCLASTFYKEDYSKWLVLSEESGGNGTYAATTPLGELVCRGPAEGTCKEALVAIARRQSGRNCNARQLLRDPSPTASEAISSVSITETVHGAVESDWNPFLAEQSSVTLTSDHTLLTLVALGIVLILYSSQRVKMKRPRGSRS